MKFKTIMLLCVAVACGLVAMLGVQQVLSGQEEVPEEEPEKKTVKILVATQDIDPFSPLDKSNSKFKTVPAESAPKHAVTSRKACKNRVLKYGIVKGRPIVRAELTSKNHSPSDEIPDGMRVVSVRVNQTKTHSGLLRPGDRVDIVLTYKSVKPGLPTIQRTLTILQDVPVFATDSILKRNAKNVDGKEINAKNISLIVTPSHANLLMLAENKGLLTLSLRKENEPVAVDIKSYDDKFFDNFDSDGTARPEEAKKKPETVADDKSFQTKRSSFKDFLSADPAKKETNLAETEPKNQPAEKLKWKLTIFDGTTARVEEVELPEEPKPKNHPAEKEGEKSTQPPSSREQRPAV